MPKIIPSQAWVDMTAAEDAFLIGFSEKNQQHLPGLFFPPHHISLTKSSCYGFDRWSSPLSQGLPSDQDSASAQLQGNVVAIFPSLNSTCLYLALIFSGASASTLQR